MNNENIFKVDFGEKLGYAEMFELSKEYEQSKLYCRLVQFDSTYPNRVSLATNATKVIGVTSINPGNIASDPDEWPFKYMVNEFGDLLMTRQLIYRGIRKYDEEKELSYIQPIEESAIVPLVNSYWKNDQHYVKRSYRKDWVKVTLLGKAIIEDNGLCTPGKYCTLYKGKDENLYGTVVPHTNEKFKLYVLNRLSEKTIMVFFKN